MDPKSLPQSTITDYGRAAWMALVYQFPGLGDNSAAEILKATTRAELFSAVHGAMEQWDNFRYGPDMDEWTFNLFMEFIHTTVGTLPK